MIKVVCYSEHPEMFILGNCDGLHKWTKPIKMLKNQEYFEWDFEINDCYLEFKFQSKFECEQNSKKIQFKSLSSYAKLILCIFNKKEFNIIYLNQHIPNDFLFLEKSYYFKDNDSIPKYIEFDNFNVVKLLDNKNTLNYIGRLIDGNFYYLIPWMVVKKNMAGFKKFYNHKKGLCYICNKHAEYNYKHTRFGSYCKDHRLDNMPSILSPLCWYPDCVISCSFSKKGIMGSFCKKHKHSEMLGKKKLCKFLECTITPSFGFGGSRVYCAKHKEKGMTNNVTSVKICKTEMCDTQVSNKYDGYCFRCFVHLFFDKPNARNYKTKEFAVVEFIKNKFPNLNWICDKRSGISGRRPDLLCNTGDQIIIIEVDENAHNSEEYCSCENKRIMQISQDLDHKPIIFIRFNPDSYTVPILQNKNGGGEKRVLGCWKLTKTGLQTISNKKKWEERLNILSNTVSYWIENKTNKTVEQIFLFYNGFSI